LFMPQIFLHKEVLRMFSGGSPVQLKLQMHRMPKQRVNDKP
jgi:hypothetical protein